MQVNIQFTGYPQHPTYQGNPDPLYQTFAAVAGPDGQIEAMELQQCLTRSGVHGNLSPFSLETCRVMIAMLDRDMTGKMGFNEFKELWACLSQWKQTFINFDRDRSGTMDAQELAAVIRSFGYNLSPQAFQTILKRYSKAGGFITFDDFVALSVRLRALSDAFRRRDPQRNGTATFQYDDFLRCTLCL
ncbi:sorcin-like [Saccoglossus kowalevskii]|uniref:Sorcin-like n=1 Tax=Saccoglossus kowalevskii TaxID=10224 RepID=A0ABM0H0S9_SACKO|nr:PREDICTED: sorcin-like [Saccoglossus kowalevskii]